MSIRFAAETVLSAKDNTSGVFAAMERNAKRAGMSVRNLQRAGERMKDWGVKAAAGTGAFAVAASSAILPSRDLSKSLKEVESLGVGGAALDKLSDSAIAFTKRYGGAAQGVVRASYDIQSAMNGITGDELSGVTIAAATMAKATKASNETATSYLATMSGIFKSDVAKEGYVKWSDRMAGMTASAVKMYKTTGPKMEQAFSTLGSVATSAGASAEEQLAILGLMQQTMGGSEGATKYKAFLAGVGKAQEKLGLSFVDSHGKMLDTPAILEKIKDKYGDLSKVATADLMTTAFGGEEATSFIKGMLDSTEKVRSDIKKLEKIKGLGPAIGMADTMTDSWDRLGGSVQALRLRIGKQMMPVLNPVIERLSKLADGAEKWAKANPGVAQGLMKIAMGAAVVAPALIAAGGILASVGLIAKTAAVGFTLLSGGFVPIALGVAAVAGAGALLYKHWDGIAAFSKGVWLGVRDSFKPLIQFAQPLIKTFTNIKNTVMGWLFPTGDIHESGEALAKLQNTGQRLGEALGKATPFIAAFVATGVALKTISVGVWALKGLKTAAASIPGAASGLKLLKEGFSSMADDARMATRATLNFARRNLVALVNNARLAKIATVNLAKRGFLAVTSTAKRAALAAHSFASRSLMALVAGARSATIASINLAKRGFLSVTGAAKRAALATYSFAARSLMALVVGARSATIASISLAKRGLLFVAASAKTATLATMSFATRGLLTLAGAGKAGALGGLALISKGLRAVGVAARVASIALLANPIGIAITAIAGAAYLAYKNWDKLVGWWNNSKLKEISMPLVTKTLDYAQEKWQQFQNWWKGSTLTEKAFGIATWPFQVAKTMATDFFGWWSKEPMGEKTLKVATGLLSLARGKGQELMNWWNNTPLTQKAFDIATAPANLAKAAAQGIFTWWTGEKFDFKTMNVNSGPIKTAMEWIEKLKNVWANFNPGKKIMAVGGSVKKAAGNMIGNVKSGASSMISSVGSALGFNVDGARAMGGPVSAGGIYQVNERGPEVYRTGGQSYLMASQSGTITPLRSLFNHFRPRNNLPAQGMAQDANSPVYNRQRNLSLISNQFAGSSSVVNNQSHALSTVMNQFAGSQSAVNNQNSSLSNIMNRLAGSTSTINNASTINQPATAFNAPTMAAGFDAPLVGSQPEQPAMQEGKVDAEITVRLETSEGLQVRQSGVETHQRGSLIRNVGVSMQTAAYSA